MTPIPSSTSSSEGATAPSPRGWPKAFLLSLVLFYLLEHVVWSLHPWLVFLSLYSTPGFCDVTRTTARIRLLSRSQKPPIILLGSSQVREGLDCLVFEELLPGRSCVNLGVNGGSPLDAEFLAGRLDRRAPRRVTIMGLFPRIMHTPPKASFFDAGTLGCLVRGGAFPKMELDDYRLVVGGLLQSQSETLRNRDSLFNLYARLGDDWPAAWAGTRPPEPERQVEVPQQYQPVTLQREPRVQLVWSSGAQEVALDDFLRREASRGNRALVVDFPRVGGYDRAPDAHVRYEALMERLARRHDVVLVRPKDLPPLTEADYETATHLNASGRLKVSRRLAERVRELEGN